MQVLTYEFPFLEVDLDNNDDQTAHLLTSDGHEKVLTFTNCDQENKQSLIGKTLPINGSFFYELHLKEQELIAEENKAFNSDIIIEEGIEKQFLFEKDVVNSLKKYHFFGVPKFGSVLAFRLSIPFYLNAESLNDFLTKTKQYQIDLQELEETKLNNEKQFLVKLEEMQKTGEDVTAFLKAQSEIEYPIVELARPVSQTKHFLIVFDNLGEDTPIQRPLLKKLMETCVLIKKNWEAKNLQLLQDDVNLYISMTDKTEGSPFSEFEKEYEQTHTAVKKTLESQNKDETNQPNGIPNSGFYNYYLELHLFWKQKLLDHLEDLLMLEKFNFVKFSEIFQLTFYFLGLQKSDLNFEGTNLINWKKCVSHFCLLKEQKLNTFNFEKSESRNYKRYQMTNYIYEKLQTTNWQEVAAYSFPIYILGNCLLNLTKLRLETVQLKKQEFANKVEFRLKKIEAAKERLEKKKEEMEADKLKFYNAESEVVDKTEHVEGGVEEVKNEFNEKEWEEKWVLVNPEIEIPEEPVFDQNNDVPSDYTFDRN